MSSISAQRTDSSSAMTFHTVVDVQLKLHSDVQVLADEWSGISDPKVRRKLQNRLNQRAARRRKVAQQIPSTVCANDQSADRAVARINQHARLMCRLSSLTSDSFAASSCQPHPTLLALTDESAKSVRLATIPDGRPTFFRSLEPTGLQCVDPSAFYPLPADHLLSLIYYNVHRALVSNVNTLSLDLRLMCTDTYPSPFLMQPLESPYVAALPSSLRPTLLQTTIPHHPQWDIFPDAALRDSILSYGEDNIDDIELCHDLLGGDSFTTADEDPQMRTGMIVWGEPHDVTSWEVTEKFARKYSSFLIGAETLLMSTNEWRRKRGEPPICFYQEV